jgi:hypothetical protein
MLTVLGYDTSNKNSALSLPCIVVAIIVHEYNSNTHLNLSYHDIILFPLQRTSMILS